MGMGYAANYADVIEDKDLKKLCPKAYKRLMDAIKKEGGDLDELAQLIYFNDEEPESEVMEALEGLKTVFEKITGGLEIDLCWHDHDDYGDIYDGINGHYWAVDGMYQLTPAGKKFEKKVDRRFFVTFG